MRTTFSIWLLNRLCHHLLLLWCTLVILLLVLLGLPLFDHGILILVQLIIFLVTKVPFPIFLLLHIFQLLLLPLVPKHLLQALVKHDSSFLPLDFVFYVPGSLFIVAYVSKLTCPFHCSINLFLLILLLYRTRVWDR